MGAMSSGGGTVGLTTGKTASNYLQVESNLNRSTHCTGEHSYYMASEVEVPERGKLVLVGFCTHCAAPMHLEFDILKNKGINHV